MGSEIEVRIASDLWWKMGQLLVAVIVGSASTTAAALIYIDRAHDSFMPRNEISLLVEKLMNQHDAFRAQDGAVMTEIVAMKGQLTTLQKEVGDLEKRIMEREIRDLRKRLGEP